ncbi:MAG: STAS domain-containing protein [Eubacteriales bacterium]|nr:STAS domain-containing protein [Eubacteriales bacterium]
MKISTAYENGRLTVRLSGELDHHGARGSMSEVDRLIDHRLPHDLFLDLSGLSFMDSSGIALILRIHKRMRELDGRLWVINPTAQPQRVIDAAGIDRLVPISNGVREVTT